jgi:cell division septation protein DedD
MDRLKARGEPAFLVMREGRTSVYVGPFGSRDNASQKIAGLRTEYQDCFVKTL